MSEKKIRVRDVVAVLERDRAPPAKPALMVKVYSRLAAEQSREGVEGGAPKEPKKGRVGKDGTGAAQGR